METGIFMLKSVLVLNGPNLNLLGSREPALYGDVSYSDLENELQNMAKELAIEISVRQSNHEGQLIDWIQEGKNFDAIVINPAAYGHTSVALLDALLAVDKPVVEVHLSQIFRRESFRHQTYTSKVATLVICGAGVLGYRLGILALMDRFA